MTGQEMQEIMDIGVHLLVLNARIHINHSNTMFSEQILQSNGTGFDLH